MDSIFLIFLGIRFHSTRIPPAGICRPPHFTYQYCLLCFFSMPRFLREIKSVLSLLFSSWAFTCCIFFLTSGTIVVFQRSTNSQKGDLHRTYLLRYQNSSALHFMHYYWYMLFSRETHVAKAFKPSSLGLNWAFHEPK